MRWIASLVFCVFIYVSPCLGDEVGIYPFDYTRRVEAIDYFRDQEEGIFGARVLLDDGLEFTIDPAEFMEPYFKRVVQRLISALEEIQNPSKLKTHSLQQPTLVSFSVDEIKSGLPPECWKLLSKLASLKLHDLEEFQDEYLKYADEVLDVWVEELLSLLSELKGKISFKYNLGDTNVVQSYSFSELLELFRESLKECVTSHLSEVLPIGAEVDIDYKDDGCLGDWKISFDEVDEKIRVLPTDRCKESVPTLLLHVKQPGQCFSDHNVYLSDGSKWKIAYYSNVKVLSDWHVGDRIVVLQNGHRAKLVNIGAPKPKDIEEYERFRRPISVTWALETP